MYELNKIYNVNAYEAIKDIPDKSIDCVYIDVPYLYHNGGGGTSDVAKRIKQNDAELRGSNGEFTDITKGFDFNLLDDLCRVMKKINIYIWCSKLQILDLMKYFVDEKKCFFEILTWCKTNPIPAVNNTWLPDIEYCLYFREENVKLNDGYNLKSKWYIEGINQKDKRLFGHPTIKPLELVKRHLLHTTQKGDVVLDTFIGSGTTAVACQQTGRNFIGFEIDPQYYNIAVDRISGLTKQEKEMKDNGQTDIFDFINQD